MKKTVYKDEFIRDMTTGNGFSRQGAGILFDFLETLEEDTGIELEYDVVAFRCDFEEMTLSDIIDGGYVTLDSEEARRMIARGEKEEAEDYITEFLNENTLLCGAYYDNEEKEIVFIFQSF